MIFTNKDLRATIITGLTAGFSAWQIFVFLELPRLGQISYAWLLVLVPILWILGVNLGYLLGRFIGFFNQFGKFSVIGFTNAAVDFGVLYLLIGLTGIASGIFFAVFKLISFLVAVFHSYLWNKYWVFDARASSETGREVTKFFVVSILAAIINVAAASLVVNLIGPQFGLTPEAWAGVGAAIGSATALVVSFVGFKVFVFRK